VTVLDLFCGAGGPCAEPPDDAWPNLNGYYRVTLSGGARVYAHRRAYERVHGPIPEGLVLDHLCRNRWCCNPEHLQPVSNMENILRGESPPARNARKQCCPKAWDRRVPVGEAPVVAWCGAEHPEAERVWVVMPRSFVWRARAAA
jgi:hypothetical protein